MTKPRRDVLPRQAGLTLIELLIGIAISSVVMIAFLTLYAEGLKYFFNQNARADTLEDSRYPMAWISRDIREAVQIQEVFVSIDGTSYTTSSLCLVLEVPAIDGTGSIIGGVSDHIVYLVAGNRLLRIVEADALSSRVSRSRPLAETVSAFGLAYLQADGMTELMSNFSDAFIVNVTLSSSRPGRHRSGQPFVETLSTQAKLRNKAET